MNDCTDDCDLAEICSQRHWSIYWLIILGSFVFVTGRLLTLGLPTANGEVTPFMSANDRSRWATVRALGDHGTYEIDKVIQNRSKIHWDSIDKVKHFGKDGRLHFYSSKPPLLATIVTGSYWITKSGLGLSLADDTLITVKIILVLVNAFPWLLYLCLLGKTLERIQIRDWARYFIVAVAGFGTYLSTFVVTLNNHLPAAIAVMAAIHGLMLITNHNNKKWQMYAYVGLASALSASFELPALSFFCLAALVCLIKSPVHFTTGFLPGALLVTFAFFGTNRLAHNDWRPPYAHKGDGAVFKVLSNSDIGDELGQEQLPASVKNELANFQLKAPKVYLANWPFKNEPTIRRWIVEDLDGHKFTIVNRYDSNEYEIRTWDNWYDYDGSYWTSDRKSELDRGQSNTTQYLFHVLFGHHGIFSLTPIWLFSLAGMLTLVFSNRLNLRWLGSISLLLSIIVIGFYSFYVPGHDRNYGGSTSCFRWALWLAPFWLICMAPIVDWMGKSKRGRAVCLFLLVISALSALYAADNPWTHPWLYQIWEHTGLPK